jgi:uncharacterized membrane protein
MAIAGYLTIARWFDTAPAGCDAGSGCGLVQASRFASLLGIPTAAWGFALYLTLAAVAVSVRDGRLHSRLSLALSGTGVVVSLYLTAVSLVAIGASCVWCLASLGAVVACFAVALAQARRGAPRRTIGAELGTVAMAAVILVSALHLYYRERLVPATGAESSKLRALAHHLDATGARFYGASWCGRCTDQKAMFRDAAPLLPYVECAPEGRRGPQTPLCRTQRIERYPTWIIRGQRYEGPLEVEVLVALSSFDWSESAPARHPTLEEPAAADRTE